MFTNKNILFVVPYPEHFAPSQRFRVEQFLHLIEREGLCYNVAPFWDQRSYRILYKKGYFSRKFLGLLKGYLRRIGLLFRLNRYDFVFVHREATPLGPPVFEWVAAKLLRKKIIYDFDDAIWISDTSNPLLNWLKAYWKIRFICRWAKKVAAGNQYLYEYASQFNQHVILLPTSVDVEHGHNRLKDQHTKEIILGWTGSHSTLKYLHAIVPVLQKLAKSLVNIRFLIICNQPPEFILPGLTYMPWKEESEIEDLMHINIGLMPLEQDKWSEGKCGFKIIQYLSLGIPAVASPVGVNKTLIEQGINGYLCTTQEDWERALLELIMNEELRTRMGVQGRQKICEHYSVQAHAGCFLNLFS